jgi:hypothetical protein
MILFQLKLYLNWKGAELSFLEFTTYRREKDLWVEAPAGLNISPQNKIFVAGQDI